jgi:DNA-binding XRE family transcriptional regulator
MDPKRKKAIRESVEQALKEHTRPARERRSLTQAEVAELVDISGEVYGRIERGESIPSIPTLVTLCYTLQESADRLLGLTQAGTANAVALISIFAKDAASRERYPPAVRSILRTVTAFEPSTQQQVDRILRGVHRMLHEAGRAKPPTRSTRARRRPNARGR